MSPLKTFYYSFKRSLFDLSYYREIAAVKFWFSFKYLLFLLFLILVVKGSLLGGQYLYRRPSIQPKINEIVTDAVNFYPVELEVKIRNGRLYTNVEEPYYFNAGEVMDKPEDKHLLVIDTRGSIDNYPDYNAYILATRNGLVYPSESSDNRIDKISVFYFRDLKQDFTLNKKIYDSYLEKIVPYMDNAMFFIDWFVVVALVVFILFGPFFWSIGVLFSFLSLTFVVWLVNLIFKKNFTYGSLYKMGIHAVTWPIILTELTKLSGIQIPGVFFLSYLIFMVIILNYHRTD